MFSDKFEQPLPECRYVFYVTHIQGLGFAGSQLTRKFQFDSDVIGNSVKRLLVIESGLSPHLGDQLRFAESRLLILSGTDAGWLICGSHILL